jgi:hypothetical protein
MTATVLLSMSKGITGFLDAIPDVKPSPSFRRSLDRTSAIDPSALMCQLGASGFEAPEIKALTIPYYYALGTKQNRTMDPVELFNLEQLVYESVAADIAWCYSYQNPSAAADSDRGRRAEMEVRRGSRRSSSTPDAWTDAQTRRGREAVHHDRRLSILSVAAGPTQSNVGRFN